MDGEALFLQDRDTSATAFETPLASSRWQGPIYHGPGLAGDIFTTAVVFTGLGLAIMEPTSHLITVFPREAPTLPLDVWMEVDVRLPPKKTRPLTGRLVKRGRAKFRTAFGDELIEM